MHYTDIMIYYEWPLVALSKVMKSLCHRQMSYKTSWLFDAMGGHCLLVSASKVK